jgi:hypothetical protein
MLRHSGQSLNGDRYIHPFSLLSLPRQPCHGGCECAIKKASSDVVYPTLTRSNYIELSLVMMVNSSVKTGAPWQPFSPASLLSK